MNASTDQQTNPENRHTDDERPVSVYSVSFGRDILTDAEREFLMERTKFKHAPKVVDVAPKPVRRVMNRRNLGLLAAILGVAVIHFSFQLNFSRSERSALRRPLPSVEAPAEPDVVTPAPISSAEPDFSPEAVSAPSAIAPPAPRRDVAPRVSKPPATKSEPTESRADRLRRAEKILTGI